MLSQAQLTDIEQEVRACFIHEDAPEYLALLEQGILALNTSNPSDDRASQHWLEMLRAVHTLKGGAALSQLHHLSQLAHRIEDLLEALGDRRVQNPDIAYGLLLRSVDEVRRLLAQAGAGVIDPSQLEIVEELEQFLATGLAELANGLGRDAQITAGGVDPVRVVLETDFKECLERSQARLKTAAPAQIPAIFEDLANDCQALAEILNLGWLHERSQAIQTLVKNEPHALPNLAADILRDLSEASHQAIAGTTPASAINIATAPSKPDTAPSKPSAVPDELAAPPGNSTFQSISTEAISPSAASAVESTMRVPVRRLDRLADVVGELLISYETLVLDQQRLQKTNQELKKRSRQFLRVREQIQTLYDQMLLPGQALLGKHSGRSYSGKRATLNSDTDFDPLEMDRFTELHSVLQDVQELLSRVEESTQDIDLLTQSAQETAGYLRQNLDHLRNDLTEARMAAFSTLAERFRRPLWDLNQRYGKSVQLHIEGGNTPIDRAILDQLYEPLLHLIRNAFDHGIEQPAERLAQGKSKEGQITIAAERRGVQVTIAVADDGKGIDLERVKQRAQALGLITDDADSNQLMQMLFTPGFSTAKQISELSGRGVGLDVVKSQVARLRGTVEVHSSTGLGTCFVLSVPLTLNIMPLLVCQSPREQGPPATLAIPSTHILELVDLPATSAPLETLLWREELIPVVPLSRLMPAPSAQYVSYLHSSPTGRLQLHQQITAAVVINVKGQPVALQVHQLLAEREMVLKAFDDLVRLPLYFPGCTILPTGEVVPVLAPDYLQEWVKRSTSKPKSPQPTPPQPAIAPPPAAQASIMVVDDSLAARRWLSRSLEKSGYQVIQCRDGQDALERLNEGLQCNLLITDIEMPRMDGFQLLKQIRQRSDLSLLPVAMLTSRQGDRHIRQARLLGANAYFTKPLDTQALIQSLNKLLGGKG